MKNVQEIQELLEKFWTAESSVSEEVVLSDYFAGENVDPSLSYAQSYFHKSKNNIDITTSVVSKLVDKYFNAETTFDEEGLIKEYFAQDNISVDLAKYKMLFQVINKAQAVSYNKELVLDINKKDINKKESSENVNKDRTAKVIKFNWWKTAAAASVITLGGFFVANNIVNKSMPATEKLVMNKSNVIEPKNAEEAYEMTVQALALVSNKYKKGEEQILQGMSNFHDAANLTN